MGVAALPGGSLPSGREGAQASGRSHSQGSEVRGAAIVLSLDLREIGWDCLPGNGPGTVSLSEVRGEVQRQVCARP